MISSQSHVAPSSRDLLMERFAISELVQSWALYRDVGDWNKLRETVHPDGIMTATWFEGSFEAFIAAIQASWRKGSSSQHFQGGTLVEMIGNKAIAQTRMSILVRGLLQGTAVDVNCVGVFYDRVEKRDGVWRILKRNVIYDKDSIAPVNPGDALDLPSEQLLRYPEGYRHLAYLQSSNGGTVNPDLPTAQGDARDHLIEKAQNWLSSNA